MSKAQAQKHRAVSLERMKTPSHQSRTALVIFYMGEANEHTLKILIVFATMGLSACQTGKTAWQYYDECAKAHTSFVETMRCGKKSRNETCDAQNTCSDRGNALVMYTDSLVTSVKSKELSEAEATRKWVEYRRAEQNSYMQSRAAATAAILDSAPQTTNCNTYGDYTSCTTY